MLDKLNHYSIIFRDSDKSALIEVSVDGPEAPLCSRRSYDSSEVVSDVR